MLGLIWVQFVCNGYEQTTLVDNELMRLGDINRNEDFQFIKKFFQEYHLSV